MPDEIRVRIDVDHGHGRNGLVALEIRQFVKHLVTEPAALARDDDETLFQGYLRWGASPMDAGGCWDFEALTCLAKNSTVVGGTSPTAVT